ncbi:hypothetical protein B5M47_02405 [candidate division CPR3 bacterium 4484_211]|uniref:Uncharacterized protein n=1 Tax=candidate division CPR3 bacterium 4484_211 TaxID=1968527 RepID=A0A1W9NYA3_UNCC3|nr:MAG: hypothetical protein B5M47_02405 [candidate division CPR3 bacterium 4484_211]
MENDIHKSVSAGVRKCIICGKPVPVLSGAEDTRGENMFCPECAARFVKDISGVYDAPDGKITDVHHKALPPEIGQRMTSWDPKKQKGQKAD